MLYGVVPLLLISASKSILSTLKNPADGNRGDLANFLQTSTRLLFSLEETLTKSIRIEAV